MPLNKLSKIPRKKIRQKFYLILQEDEKKSLRQKINTLHDMILTVQNAIGKFASLGERIKK